MAWEAWAIFRKGQLLYDCFFFEKEQAYLYKLASYQSMATEENPAGCWMMQHGITVEKVRIEMAAEEPIELKDVVKKPRSKNFDQLFTILSQPSTWKGIVILFACLGIQLNPDDMIEIVKSFALIYGALAIVMDKN